MITPEQLSAIQAKLTFDGAETLSAYDALGVIGYARKLEIDYQRVAGHLAQAQQTLDNVRSVAGGGPLPAECAGSWRQRAERAEGLLRRLAALRERWRRQLAGLEYELAMGRPTHPDNPGRRVVLQALIADVDQILTHAMLPARRQA